MQFNFACLKYCIYDQNFAIHHSERLKLIRVLWTDTRSVLIRVKVNSKSRVGSDKEGKSALHRAICCCDDRLLSRAVNRRDGVVVGASDSQSVDLGFIP